MWVHWYFDGKLFMQNQGPKSYQNCNLPRIKSETVDYRCVGKYWLFKFNLPLSQLLIATLSYIGQHANIQEE